MNEIMHSFQISLFLASCRIYHLFTDTEGNSGFVAPRPPLLPEAKLRATTSGRGATKLTVFPSPVTTRNISGNRRVFVIILDI